MVISAAVFAIDLLGSDNLGSETILVSVLYFTIASIDKFCPDSQVLEILSLIREIFFEALKQG